MTDTAEHAAAPPAPRWIAPWLALLAPLYVISPLALLGLPYLRRLPKPALWVLAFYALSQQLPALFTPEPLLASVLALARTLLMFGLMGVGVALGDSQRLRPFAIGLGVVYLTALVYSVRGDLDFLASRLGHPYMTPITLGLAGAFGIWLALFGQGAALWRAPLGLAALAVLLLSGSRGPLVATIAACLIAIVCQKKYSKGLYKRIFAFLIGTTVLVGFLNANGSLKLDSFTRLMSLDTTGRDIIWSDTLSIIRTYPLTGVGSYRLGYYLTPITNQCTVFPDEIGNAGVCPSLIALLGNPWLIAHNITLHQLSESGPLGVIGLFVVISMVGILVFLKSDSLSVAIFCGLLTATITDNTLITPSPFFAEIFWIFAGLHLKQWPIINFNKILAFKISLLIAALIFIVSIPAFNIFFPEYPANRPQRKSISYFSASRTFSPDLDYSMFVRFILDTGSYRLVLKSCDKYCVTLQKWTFDSVENRTPLISYYGKLKDLTQQTLRLEILRAESSFSVNQIAIFTWKVKKEMKK